MPKKETLPPVIEEETELDEELDEQIQEIKTFFNDPKYKKESSKLRHSIRFVLAEIAGEEEEAQRTERERQEKEKGPSMMKWIFGDK